MESILTIANNLEPWLRRINMLHRRKTKKLNLFDQIIWRFKLEALYSENNYKLLLPVSLVIIIIIIIIIIIKVNYNYHENYPRILWCKFSKRLYNFNNFIRRRMADHIKVTTASHVTIAKLAFFVAAKRYHYRIKNNSKFEVLVVWAI